MKRGKLRDIVVDGKTFRWNYFCNHKGFANYPYPYSYYLFVPEKNQRLKVRVYFTKYYEPQILYEGMVCQYQGEQIVINLCRPFLQRK